jgi:hypothetical protein
MSLPRTLLIAGVVGGLVVLGPSSISGATGTAVRPNQHFIGFVNGRHTGAVVYTVCPGPLVSGEMGPPAGSQTVAVQHVRHGGGDTGSTGHSVYALIPGSPPAITQLSKYKTPGAIPTSAQVPCQGPGTVYFSSCPLPQPCGAGAKTDDVNVTFEDIAV